MVHKKKQDDVDDDANKATTNGSGTTIIISATMTAADTTTSPRRNRSGRSGGRVGVLINTGLSITLFFALVQFFDPSLSKHREDDIAHHHWNHNPILSSLTDFAQGKDGLQRLRNNSNSSASSSITSRSQVSAGRERILSLLEEAGIAKDLSNSQIERLPKWEQIVDLYGDKAVIVGKEDCAAFCARVPTAKRRLAVAGMFNTGTNLLDTQMQKNIRIMPGGTGTSLWQVPWGKHRTADVKWSHTAATMEKIDKNDVLPVVIIRDPLSWLQSMCAHPYAASWRHGSHHCPNLVASDSDRKHFRKFVKDQKNIFPVTVKFDKQSQYHYTSLVHLWSEWYAQYLEVDYPILIVRYEDLVFQPVNVLREIAECVEGTLNTPIRYQVASSKTHGSGTDYIKALIKTADAKGRPYNMTAADMEYATKHLDARLMVTFNYNVPTTLSVE